MPVGSKCKPPVSNSPFEDIYFEDIHMLLYSAYARHHCYLAFFKENENIKVSSSDNTKYGADDYSVKTWLAIPRVKFLTVGF